MVMPADHILSYARDLAGGGVERALLRLAGGWLAQGRRVTLVIGLARGPLAAELPDGIDLIELGSASMGRLRAALPGIVRDRAPDILFCPGNHYTAIAALTRLRLGLGSASPPIIAKLSNAIHRSDHGPLLDLGHRAWLRLHGRFLDALVAMSPATAVEAAHATGMTGRIHVIPNPPALPLRGAVASPLPPILSGARFILGVGRLVPQKRWDRLVAALPALPGVHALIAGEGPQRAALFAQATVLGVGERLHLPGHLADPLPVMKQAAVLVLPSDFEGVPGVLGEALSVGTPVVTTDSSPSVREIVDSAALGSIVPRDDPAALIAALRGWLAPDAVRPAAVARPGIDSAMRYLALFDRLAC